METTKLAVKLTPKNAVSLAVTGTVAVFAADWLTPSVFNVSVCYACVIVVLLWADSLRWLWGWAAVVIVLALFGLRAGETLPLPGVFSAEAINRYITVGMLIGTAGFVHFNVLLTRRFLAATDARERAQQSLRRTQDELAHASRVTTLGELGASIAHEISQPLAGVLMNGSASLRWLAANPPNSGEARAAIERVIRDGNLANAVIGRIRALLQKAPVVKSPLRLDRVVREVAALVEPEARRKDATLYLDLKDDLPLVSGDRVQLQQVLLNLILNAIEAMRTVTDRSREVHVCTGLQADNQVLVTVQDVGIGFDAEGAAKVFDPFYTTKAGGMGMGLSISRSIIENHDGRLWANANEGPGATFQFSLPVPP